VLEICIPEAGEKINTAIVVNFLESELFMTYGKPETFVLDNGSQFRAEVF